MANIQPFDYQKRTNIEEHNQLVDKVNEIVDVINNTNLETINTDIDNLETRADKTDSDLASIQAKDITQDSEIADLKPRVDKAESDLVTVQAKDIDQDSEIANINSRVGMTESEITNLKTRADKTDSDMATVQAKDITQDSEIADLKPRVDKAESEITNLKTRADKTDSDMATVQAKDITQDSEIDGISKSLVSDVIMSDGTTMGSVQVSIERKDGALITSQNYKWGRDIGIRLEAGSQAGYVKAVIDLSDGTVLESNEYRIVEVMESDIYVTAITLVADQNAGTLGGNITYSNGTTQTINTVSVPTSPGVTSALESLQSRMAAVEQKNTTQDGQITALDTKVLAVEQKNTSQDGQISALDAKVLAVEQKNTSQDGQISALDTRVKAIEDTPGIGQFETGKLGTIAGATVDGRIKAESDGSGSVNGWIALKDRVTAVEQKNTSQDEQISSINSEISGLKTKNTEQDNTIAGKVAINQGTANAGKVLGIGSNGNVSPIEPTSGGEVWEKVDLSNFPSDWIEGDRIKIAFSEIIIFLSGSNWNSNVTISDITPNNTAESALLEVVLGDNTRKIGIIQFSSSSKGISIFQPVIRQVSELNTGYLAMMNVEVFNGSSRTGQDITINTDNISRYVTKLYRLKKG